MEGHPGLTHGELTAHRGHDNRPPVGTSPNRQRETRVVEPVGRKTQPRGAGEPSLTAGGNVIDTTRNHSETSHR